MNFIKSINEIRWKVFITTLTLVFIITLLSFSKSPPPGGGIDCSTLSSENVVIQFNFSPASFTAFNSLRTPSYQGYIPTRDLRMAYYQPAETNCDIDSYYLTVSVKSTACGGWSWSRVFSANEALTNQGKMQIGVPSEGAFEVTATYHEIKPSSVHAPDFGSPARYSLREVYPDYLTLPSSGQPVFFDFDGLSIRCVPADSANKTPGMSDWGSINDYIDLNDLNF